MNHKIQEQTEDMCTKAWTISTGKAQGTTTSHFNPNIYLHGDFSFLGKRLYC